MTSGVINVYKCAHCKQLHARPTLASFNASHSEYYSDLKPVNQNFPIYTAVTVCACCHELTPLVNQYCEGFYESSDHVPMNWIDARGVMEPDLYGYIKIIQDPTLLEAISEFPQDRRLIVRMKIYELFNDRVRYGKGSRYLEDNDEQNWLFNSIELLKEIDYNDIQSEHSTLLKIDVLRSLGRFDEALDILSKETGKVYLHPYVKEVYTSRIKRRDLSIFNFKLKQI